MNLKEMINTYIGPYFPNVPKSPEDMSAEELRSRGANVMAFCNEHQD